MQTKQFPSKLGRKYKTRPKSAISGQIHKSIAGKSLPQIFSSEALQTDVGRALYGCCAIENAGGPLSITTHMCKLVFTGIKSDVSLCLFSTGSNGWDGYGDEYDHLIRMGKEWDSDAAIRALRREVQRHVEAFQYMMQKLIVEDRELDEEIVKKCHWIMMKTPDDAQRLAAGRYRSGNLGEEYGERPETDTEYADRILTHLQLKPNHPPPKRTTVPKYYSTFVHSTNISRQMALFVHEYNNNIRILAEERQTNRNFDMKEYVHLAARTHLCFFFIHPFKAGNNRLGLMLLNTILLKYTGKVAVLGADPEARNEYLEYMWMANSLYHHQVRLCLAPWSTTSHYAFQYMVERAVRRSQHDVPDDDSDGGVAITEPPPDPAVVEKVRAWSAGVSVDDVLEESRIDCAFPAEADEGGVSCL